MKVDLKQVHCILHINLYIRNFWPETKRQEKKKKQNQHGQKDYKQDHYLLQIERPSCW